MHCLQFYVLFAVLTIVNLDTICNEKYKFDCKFYSNNNNTKYNNNKYSKNIV